MQITLQNRITTLMIISSILFIATFTLIQLSNQMNNIDRYNTYQSGLSATIVKNNLEAIMRQAQAKEDIPRLFQSAIGELRDANIIKDEATIFDPEGKVIASSDVGLKGQRIDYRDLNASRELERLDRENKWLVTGVDKAKNSIYMYLTLKLDPRGAITDFAKLSFPLSNVNEALLEVYQPVAIAVVIIILANLIFGYVLSKNVLGPIRVLNEVTKVIAGGDLSVRTRINSNDELQELGQTFNFMADAFVKMKEKAENANPLTKLPGNIVIHEEVEKRIHAKRKFVVIYCDLDNFKAFNDKYGIAKGDDAIKLTAEMFRLAVKNRGNPDDFVGHEGGDDFILLTTCDKAVAVADFIVKEFDSSVRALYTQEDLQRGFILAAGRDGVKKEFPIMTISLAGVTNEFRPIQSYGEVTNIAAEIKKKAKAISKSVFVMDQRKA